MKLLKEDILSKKQYLMKLFSEGKLDVGELVDFDSNTSFGVAIFVYSQDDSSPYVILDYVFNVHPMRGKEGVILDNVDRILKALKANGVDVPINEALYGREEIDDYLKKMKEIGIKNLGDLRKFKQNVKSDIGKDTNSDIEQIRAYRDTLGKDFKIQDDNKVSKSFDLDEALGLKESFLSDEECEQKYITRIDYQSRRYAVKAYDELKQKGVPVKPQSWNRNDGSLTFDIQTPEQTAAIANTQGILHCHTFNRKATIDRKGV